MPKVLHLAPHPDDEALAACGTLLQLRDAGWNVVNLACSLGRSGRAARRREELVEACGRAGFELRTTAESVALSSDDDLTLAERRLTDEIGLQLRDLSPELVVGPSPHDGHHGHEVVGRATRLAIEALPARSRPRWWMWELWATLPAPTLYVAVPRHLQELAETVLQAHAGELDRNDYAHVPHARGQLAAALGVERVFGWGSQGSGDEYAEVLMEILCDDGDGWPLAQPRRLDPSDPLTDAVSSGVDAREWLIELSARAKILRAR
jgi:LmbE family N-acetylglucosaminyl deacetylase